MKPSKPRVSPGALLALFAAAVGIYFAVYVVGSNSDAFLRAEAAIKASPVIASMVGEVEDVTLKPLKGFRLKPRRGDRGAAHMSMLISGSKRDALITVHFRQAQDTWAIVHATIDDQPVDLQ